ncbi:MAG: Flp pilus assembly complex ATPase component TadA [Planctomycetaceae bacterium]|nr:Flp pilus assembly complex ATPase component TadA [Planctomycetaceae bacterium]
MTLREALVQRKFMTTDQADELERTGESVQSAVSRGWLREQDYLQTAADVFGLRFLDLSDLDIPGDLIRLFPSQDLFRHQLLPIARDGDFVIVASSDPFAHENINNLSATSGELLDPVLACREQISRCLHEHLGVGGGTIQQLVAQGGGIAEEGDNDEIDEESQTSSVIKLVNELLIEAISQRASDIHLEPDEGGLSIRYRVDGLLRVQPAPPEIHRFRNAIVSRLKIMAKLNIAEKRLPQDGRINVTVAGREIDVRVSIIPMLHGEGVVMRLLDKSQAKFDLAALEFPPGISAKWNALIRRPHGMILVTGPTGSGKTTTLYSSLSAIRDPRTKIVTIEDPVEYQIKGISQIQVQSKIGLNFAAGLRSILRHDPDVILLGEIRDAETATNAIQAAMTGHLVLSTLHTNDASGAYTRLTDIGVDPFLVASTVEGVLAQRLVRRLCPDCCVEYIAESDAVPSDFDVSPGTLLKRAVGCKTCSGIGYRGRIPIFELLQTDRTVQRLCSESAPASDIRRHGLRVGMTTLRQSGWQRVLAGTTTVDEVIRCCTSDDHDESDSTSRRVTAPDTNVDDEKLSISLGGDSHFGLP